MNAGSVNFDVVRASVEASGGRWAVSRHRRGTADGYQAEVVIDHLVFVSWSRVSPGVALREAWQRWQAWNAEQNAKTIESIERAHGDLSRPASGRTFRPGAP